jgi:hypothetical protein
MGPKKKGGKKDKKGGACVAAPLHRCTLVTGVALVLREWRVAAPAAQA